MDEQNYSKLYSVFLVVRWVGLGEGGSNDASSLGLLRFSLILYRILESYSEIWGHLHVSEDFTEYPIQPLLMLY